MNAIFEDTFSLGYIDFQKPGELLPVELKGVVPRGVGEMVETHGASAVAAGLESLLATVLALLGRLIGEDITAQILAHPTRTDGSK